MAPLAATAFFATSLDGFIADRAGSIAFLDTYTATLPPNTDLGIDSYNASHGALVLGRRTFDTVRGFPEWPYRGVKVFVVSAGEMELGREWEGRAEVLSGEGERGKGGLLSAKEVLEEVGRRYPGLERVGVDGGEVVGVFLSERMLAEVTVTMVPVLLGEGRRGWQAERMEEDWWKLEGVRQIGNAVQCRYVKNGKGKGEGNEDITTG